MPSQRPPTIDPLAVARWDRIAPPTSPWLHEEVARRMADRLQWIRLSPRAWAHWEPVRGGLVAQDLLEGRYPQGASVIVEPLPGRGAAARAALELPWWKRLRGPRREFASSLAEDGVQMVWANMALHFAAEPQAILAAWHRGLATDGFLMFSCFGPDTLRELHGLYRELGWAPPGPQFTDMHDWGDMLVEGGFAEPVMDMERITLSWETPRALLAELRELGRNVHPARFGALRGRAWRARLEAELGDRLRQADGRLALTFEVVYGHALKPAPRLKVAPTTAVSLGDMRKLLQGGRQPSE